MWVCCEQKLIHEMADLKAQLSEAIANMIDYEVTTLCAEACIFEYTDEL